MFVWLPLFFACAFVDLLFNLHISFLQLFICWFVPVFDFKYLCMFAALHISPYLITYLLNFAYFTAFFFNHMTFTLKAFSRWRWDVFGVSTFCPWNHLALHSHRIGKRARTSPESHPKILYLYTLFCLYLCFLYLSVELLSTKQEAFLLVSSWHVTPNFGIYICVCICVFLFVFSFISFFVSVFVSAFISVFASLFEFVIYTFLCICICICICICMSICICICNLYLYL